MQNVQTTGLARVLPSTERSEETGVMSLLNSPGRGVLFVGDLFCLNSMGLLKP